MLFVQAKKTVLVVGGVGLLLLLLVVIFFVRAQSLQKGNDTNLVARVKEEFSQEKDVPLPVQLSIPKINVNATIERVGLTSLGAMGVPKDYAHVAWFDQGPRPGEVGSAVISGHYGWKNNTPVVFDNLHLLRKGDRLYIKDENEVTTSFLVHEVRIYDEYEDASGVFSSSDGKAHLNLITCEGVWNNLKKSYSHRLVVFTDKEI